MQKRRLISHEKFQPMHSLLMPKNDMLIDVTNYTVASVLVGLLPVPGNVAVATTA
jgi:hypothetical protein